MSALTDKARRACRRAAAEPATGDELADNLYHEARIEIADLAAGADIAATTKFATPVAAELQSAHLLLQGASAGVDAGNTVVVALTDAAGNTIVTKTYGATPPTANALNNLGTLDATHKVLTAGEVVKLAITQGATADLPACTLVLRYVLKGRE
jgi:hypothetical protein